MQLSIIIPTWNEAGRIVQAIERSWHLDPHEVIVADGDSPDGTAAIAEACRCTVLRTCAGRGSQLNAGARAATGDVLLFLHADNWLDSQAAGQLRAALGRPEIEIGAFRQRIDAPGRLYRLLEIGNAWRVQTTGLAYGDQGIFVRRRFFESIGGFPDAPLMEDVGLMRAARKRSRPILLPGPLHISARRWQSAGVLRQTLRNWLLLGSYLAGVPAEKLARYYPRPGAEPGNHRLS